MSRSLVGSSRIRRSAGSRISRAMWMRACSPPESRPTGTSSCSGGTGSAWPRPPRAGSDPGRSPCRPRGRAPAAATALGSRPGRCCSNRTTRSPSARSIVPASGASAPASTLSRVVLPLPFGPMRPMRVPGVMMRSRFRTSVRPPSDLASPSATSSRRERRPEAVKSMSAERVAARARASPSSSISRSASLMRALRLGGAGLGAPSQPLDLAAHGIGEGLLVGGLAPQELVAPGRGTRCSGPRSRRGRSGRRG